MTICLQQEVSFGMSNMDTMNNKAKEDFSFPNPMIFLSVFPPVTNPLAAQIVAPSLAAAETTPAPAPVSALTSPVQIENPMISQMALMPIMPFMANNKFSTNHPAPNSVPEFLYQLTKMLTDDNSQYIEWANGKWLTLQKS